MNASDVAAFFDSLAPQWDANMTVNDEIVGKILNDAHIQKGVRVLDVACGTGVLIPYYLSRDVSSVLGVDLSEKMIDAAREKFRDARVRFLCRDVRTLSCDEAFDRIVIYNALPHFDDHAALFSHLCTLLAPNGRLTVAHGTSRQKINARHAHATKNVCIDLVPAAQTAAVLQKHLCVDVVRDDETCYIVSGVKKENVCD